MWWFWQPLWDEPNGLTVVLLFGAGGQLVEVFKDRSLALPPLNATLARRIAQGSSQPGSNASARTPSRAARCSRCQCGHHCCRRHDSGPGSGVTPRPAYQPGDVVLTGALGPMVGVAPGVTLVSGPTALSAPGGVHRVAVESADEMLAATQDAAAQAQILIGAAANECFKTGKPVAVQKMVNGLGRPDYAPMPSKTAPLPMPRRSVRHGW